MTLLGQIEPALAFGFSQLGKPYDHTAADSTRFGPDKYDCSGLVCRSLWAGGMPRGNEGFGENSAAMAQWAEAHPARNIGVTNATRTRGALLILGGTTGYGDLGHVVFSLGDGRTLESSGARGVSIDNAYRLRWSHGVLAPINYTAPPPPPSIPLEDDPMAAHILDPNTGQHHAFAIGVGPRAGHLIHSWVNPGGDRHYEDLTVSLAIPEVLDKDAGVTAFIDQRGSICVVTTAGDGIPIWWTWVKGGPRWGCQRVDR